MEKVKEDKIKKIEKLFEVKKQKIHTFTSCLTTEKIISIENKQEQEESLEFLNEDLNDKTKKEKIKLPLNKI